MRDPLRRYRAIRDALLPAAPTPPTGNFARPVQTLAALIRGIGGGQRTPLPHSAPPGPAGTPPARRGKRFPRGLDHARRVAAVAFFPDAALVLTPGACATLGGVMAGRGIGRGGRALRLHGVEKGRAVPLAWRGRQSPTGHGPETLHSASVELSREGSPAGAKRVWLGDGEGEGPALQAPGHQAGGSEVCGTAMSPTARGDGTTLRLAALGAGLKPGRRLACQAVQGTREAYGPSRWLGGWAQGSQERRYGVSHRATAEEAGRLEAKRCRLATCGADQPRRGVQRHQSPLSEVQRLSWLCIAAC
jgi:hypothetical protein